MAYGNYFPLPDRDDPFEKVIFLDIDGVLNDDHYNPDKPVIDSGMVACLALIVHETNASIVLSSSWKHAWTRFEEAGFVPQSDRDQDLVTLREQLTRYDLVIEDVTPDSGSGPDARPQEIRGWLLGHGNVRSFVILDDDDFWSFGWLDRHFVCTQTPTNEIRWPGYLATRRGLTPDLAEQAIAILNDCPPLSRQEERRRRGDERLAKIREQRRRAAEAAEAAESSRAEAGKQVENGEGQDAETAGDK